MEPLSANKTISTLEFLDEAIEEAISDFEKNALIAVLKSGDLTRADYIRLLRILFHQTYFAPYTFALAAAHCDYKYIAAKEYLLHHAHEEMAHWRWVLNDLDNLEDRAPPPREQQPHASCAAYVAFNHHIATTFPIGRLAIAAVLEGIAARFGGRYGRHLMQHLALTPEHASFFLSHGELDVGHAADIGEVIASLQLPAEDIGKLASVARTAGILYRAMYDAAAVRE